jgi:glycosyl hydrolase family 113
MSARATALVLFLLTIAAAPSAVPLPAVVTGANIRAVSDERRGYGTGTSRMTIERLEKMGVNTIAVLMEGRMASVESTEIRLPPNREREAIERQLVDANAMRLATILIPHLYLDDGRWRGEIAFRDPRARDAWWTAYDAFIEAAAEIAARSGSTVLSIGVELKAMSNAPDTHARMRDLATRVRRVYRGLLTYNANWDEAEGVSFWGAVDLAGVNGYYPLTPDPERGAEQIARRLGALARYAKRDVLVLEVGYRSSPLSHVRPWEWPTEVQEIVDDNAQANAWAAVLAHWLGAPGVRGLCCWVVPTDPDDPASEPRHGFNPLNKPAEEIIGRAFLSVHGRPVHSGAALEGRR